MTSGTRERRGWVVVVVLIGVLGTVPDAHADPRNPSNAEIARSQAAVQSKAGEVGRIAAALVKADARLQASTQRAEVAAEAYNKARVDEQRAARASSAAVRLASRAQAEVENMRDQMDRLAAENYKSGGSLGPLTALVAANNPADVIHDAGVLSVMGDRQVRSLDLLAEARTRASNARSRAQAALQRQVGARQAATAAKQAAEQAQAQNQTTVRAVTAIKTRLAGELAQAQARAGLLVAARQAADRRARAAAAAGAAARAAARAAAAAAQAAAERGGDPGPPRRGGSVAAIAVSAALSQVGKPYVWGAAGPDTYDCSGLMLWAYAKAGVSLPHFSGYQYTSGRHVPLRSIIPGDFVFGSFNGTPSGIHHVAMYIGGGSIVEAPYTGATVRVQSLGGGWLPLAARPY